MSHVRKSLVGVSAGAQPILAPYSVDPSAGRPFPSPGPPALRCGACCALVLGLAMGPRAQFCPVPRRRAGLEAAGTGPERAENRTTPYARFPGRLRVEEWNSMESSSSAQNFDHPVPAKKWTTGYACFGGAFDPQILPFFRPLFSDPCFSSTETRHPVHGSGALHGNANPPRVTTPGGFPWRFPWTPRE